MRGWTLFAAASLSAMVMAAFTPTPVIAQDDEAGTTEAQPDDRPTAQELPATNEGRTAAAPDDQHPAATGLAAPAVAITLPAVGSVVSVLPPACVASVRGNIDYYRCGDVWYRPRRVGALLSYVVVDRP